MSEYDGLLTLFEEKQKSGVAKMTSLADLLANQEALTAAVKEVRERVAPPGYMFTDEAEEYMAEIANLFKGENRNTIELTLCVWGMLNGTGGTDDYSTKPPVIVGAHEVSATAIFGTIIPIGAQGKVRQFFATQFEKHVPKILAAMPELHTQLAPRVAKAGLAPGQTLLAIDFVKGGTPETVGSGSTRSRVKESLLARRLTGLGRTGQEVQGSSVRERNINAAERAPASGAGGLDYGLF